MMEMMEIMIDNDLLFPILKFLFYIFCLNFVLYESISLLFTCFKTFLYLNFLLYNLFIYFYIIIISYNKNKGTPGNA